MIGELKAYGDTQFEVLSHVAVKAHPWEGEPFVIIAASHGLCDRDCTGHSGLHVRYPFEEGPRSIPVKSCWSEWTVPKPWFRIMTEAGDQIWLLGLNNGKIRMMTTFWWHSYMLKNEYPYNQYKYVPHYNDNGKPGDIMVDMMESQGCHEQFEFICWSHALAELRDLLRWCNQPSGMGTRSMQSIMDDMDKETQCYGLFSKPSASPSGASSFSLD